MTLDEAKILIDYIFRKISAGMWTVFLVTVMIAIGLGYVAYKSK